MLEETEAAIRVCTKTLETQWTNLTNKQTLLAVFAANVVALAVSLLLHHLEDRSALRCCCETPKPTFKGDCSACKKTRNYDVQHWVASLPTLVLLLVGVDMTSFLGVFMMTPLMVSFRCLHLCLPFIIRARISRLESKPKQTPEVTARIEKLNVVLVEYEQHKLESFEVNLHSTWFPSLISWDSSGIAWSVVCLVFAICPQITLLTIGLIWMEIMNCTGSVSMFYALEVEPFVRGLDFSLLRSCIELPIGLILDVFFMVLGLFSMEKKNEEEKQPSSNTQRLAELEALIGQPNTTERLSLLNQEKAALLNRMLLDTTIATQEKT